MGFGKIGESGIGFRRKCAFQTLHSIIQTNAAAKAVFQQRLTVNRRAAQSYEKQLLAWRFLSVRYGLRSPDS